MTREEIGERAARLTMHVALNLTGSAADMIGAATDKMVDFYCATLQEAARAVCVNCARGDVPTPTERFIFGDGVTRWSHSPSITKSGEPDYCQADEIHDLIAALDKEGDHE